MHPELMHLANQTRYDDLRREAAAQHRAARDLRFWRRRARAEVTASPVTPSPVVPAQLPQLPAQVRRKMPVLTQRQRI